MKRNQFRHLIKEEMVNIFLNEMANYYKLKDNSSEAKKAVSMAKAKVKSDTKLWNALDTLEKEGEVDLIKLAYENDIDVSSYNNPQNRQVLDKELEDYIELWHEGRCGKCGRVLTVPTSISTGFGPDCLRRLNK